MAPRSAWGKSLVRDLLKKGYVMNGDKLELPKSKENGQKQRKPKRQRSYDCLDVLNIERNEQSHPFKTYLQQELSLSVWMEFEFTSERKFRIDFAIPSYKVAIEIDGGIWMRGRSGHSSGTGIKRDQEKTSLLSANGWAVIRITPDQQYSQKTIDLIRMTIKNSRISPAAQT